MYEGITDEVCNRYLVIVQFIIAVGILLLTMYYNSLMFLSTLRVAFIVILILEFLVTIFNPRYVEEHTTKANFAQFMYILDLIILSLSTRFLPF